MKEKTLVLGASTNASRYANIALRRLVQKAHDTVAFGIRKGEVSGVEIDTERIAYEGIDTITLYLNPKRQVEYYDYILSLDPRRVIFNPGTENAPFYETLREHGIEVEEACTLVLLATDQY